MEEKAGVVSAPEAGSEGSKGVCNPSETRNSLSGGVSEPEQRLEQPVWGRCLHPGSSEEERCLHLKAVCVET